MILCRERNRINIHHLEKVDATHFLLPARDSKVEYKVDENGDVNQPIVSTGGNNIADMPRISPSIINAVVESMEKEFSKPNTNDILETYFSDELLFIIKVILENEGGRVSIYHASDNLLGGLGDLEFTYSGESEVESFHLSRGEQLQKVKFRELDL